MIKNDKIRRNFDCVQSCKLWKARRGILIAFIILNHICCNMNQAKMSSSKIINGFYVINEDSIREKTIKSDWNIIILNNKIYNLSYLTGAKIDSLSNLNVKILDTNRIIYLSSQYMLYHQYFPNQATFDSLQVNYKNSFSICIKKIGFNYFIYLENNKIRKISNEELDVIKEVFSVLTYNSKLDLNNKIIWRSGNPSIKVLSYTNQLKYVFSNLDNDTQEICLRHLYSYLIYLIKC